MKPASPVPTSFSLRECRAATRRLNIGCGPVQPLGWVNIDSSNRAKLATWLPWLDALLVKLRFIPPTEFGPQTTVRNVRRGFGYAAESVGAIYCGEILEHFEPEDATRFLEEAFRVLEPGGVLRVRVPDNYLFWKSYVLEFEKVLQRARSDWNERHSRWVSMFFHDICTRRLWFSSLGHYHKWLYDEVSLILAFERAGFIDVERRRLYDSRIPGIEAVETRDNLIVEGVRPASGSSSAMHLDIAK